MFPNSFQYKKIKIQKIEGLVVSQLKDTLGSNYLGMVGFRDVIVLAFK